MSAPIDRHDRDDALDRAWKAHSTELPPLHVDAAILAAAHREAHAKPASVDDRDGDARGPSRVWWPLAAAATIAAIAFGIVELAPPVVDESTPVATDMPQQPSSARPAEVSPTAPQAMREAERSKDAASDPASKPAAAMPAPMPDMQRERLAKREAKARAAGPRDEAPAVAPLPRAGEAQSFAREGPDSRSDTGARPFPGAPAESAVAKPSAPSASAPLEASPPAPAPAAPSPRRQADAREPMVAGAAAAPDIPVHVRVERIRALFTAGDLDAAARELQALRRSQADADALLPPPLRAWAAGVPREP